MAPWYHRWTTRDEMAYLKGIGNWGETPASSAKVVEMLEAYILAAENRFEWGEIDKDAVVAFARSKRFRLLIPAHFEENASTYNAIKQATGENAPASKGYQIPIYARS